MSNATKRDIFEEMRQLMGSGEIFYRAATYGAEYLNGAHQRRVVPTAECEAELEVFREPLPEKGADPYALLDLLNEFGSPGTVAQTGGRFFGFVNGGMVPSGLAARLLADSWDQKWRCAFSVAGQFGAGGNVPAMACLSVRVAS